MASRPPTSRGVLDGEAGCRRGGQGPSGSIPRRTDPGVYSTFCVRVHTVPVRAPPLSSVPLGPLSGSNSSLDPRAPDLVESLGVVTRVPPWVPGFRTAPFPDSGPSVLRPHSPSVPTHPPRTRTQGRTTAPDSTSVVGCRPFATAVRTDEPRDVSLGSPLSPHVPVEGTGGNQGSRF